MKITFLGTGVAIDVAGKAQSSLIIEEDKVIMLDCGFGAMLRLSQAGYSVEDLDAIVITHFHLDHCGELMGILKARWLLDCGEIKIYTPKGGRNFVNSFLNSSSYLMNKLRFKVLEKEKFRVGSLRFKAIKTRHSIESMALKLDEILFSGDTSAFPELYEDVSITIHEMSLFFKAKSDFHTTPENFVDSANVKKAYFVHLYPEAYNGREKIRDFIEKHGIKCFFPDDLDVIEL